MKYSIGIRLFLVLPLAVAATLLVGVALTTASVLGGVVAMIVLSILLPILQFNAMALG